MKITHLAKTNFPLHSHSCFNRSLSEQLCTEQLFDHILVSPAFSG